VPTGSRGAGNNNSAGMPRKRIGLVGCDGGMTATSASTPAKTNPHGHLEFRAFAAGSRPASRPPMTKEVTWPGRSPITHSAHFTAGHGARVCTHERPNDAGVGFVNKPGPEIDETPLELVERPSPVPESGQIRVRVLDRWRGCRTDLHLAVGGDPSGPRRAHVHALRARAGALKSFGIVERFLSRIRRRFCRGVTAFGPIPLAVFAHTKEEPAWTCSLHETGREESGVYIAPLFTGLGRRLADTRNLVARRGSNRIIRCGHNFDDVATLRLPPSSARNHRPTAPPWEFRLPTDGPLSAATAFRRVRTPERRQVAISEDYASTSLTAITGAQPSLGLPPSLWRG